MILLRSRRWEADYARLTQAPVFRNAWRLLTRKKLVPSYTIIFAQYFIFGGVVTLLPLRIAQLGMGTIEVGIVLATFSAMFVLIQLPGGVLSDRVGRLPSIIAGLLCIIISLTALPWLSRFSFLAAAMALQGVGYGLVFPSISALIVDHTNTDERGLATGLFHALLTAGVAIGAPLQAWVAGLIGIETTLLIAPAPLLCVAVITLTILKGT